jgi:hypothetical protein
MPPKLAPLDQEYVKLYSIPHAVASQGNENSLKATKWARGRTTRVLR